MKQEYVLTLLDAVWNNIKDSVVAYMHDFRTRRLVQEHRLHLATRIAALKPAYRRLQCARPPNERIPVYADFCALPEVTEILESSVPIDRNPFESLQDQIPDIWQEWHEDATSVILKLLPKTDDDVEPQASALDLATTWFKHDGSLARSVGYPDVLYNDLFALSFMNVVDFSSNSPIEITDFLLAALASAERFPWKWRVSRIKFDYGVFNLMRQVVKLCGKDPAFTTAQEMDDLDARFFCRPCSAAHGDAYAMPWRTLVSAACFPPGFSY